MDAVDWLLQTIDLHEPVCNISVEQGLPYERELNLILSTLKIRNLYKLNIDGMYCKLQTILNCIPIYTKYCLLNKYYSHSWISHVSYKSNLSPLSIFVTLLKKYVIRKKFNTLWSIIVLLLENGAFPLLNPVQTESSNSFLSIKLISSLYCNLFNFIDDENEILKKIYFVLSFVDKFECNKFKLNGYHFDINTYYPSICGQQKDSHIPSPSFLCVLLEFGLPIFHNTLNNENKLYHLSFAKYHQLFFDKKLLNFRAIYHGLEKEEKYPVLVDGMYLIIIGMIFGDKMIKRGRYYHSYYDQNMYIINYGQNDDYYLFNLFGLNKEWMKWSFCKVWKYKTDKELKEILNILSNKNMYLNKWSGRIRECSSYYYDSYDFIKFYLKIVQFQQSLNGKEIAFWMKKYENNGEIIHLLLKQSYLINENFYNDTLFIHFWSLLCHKEINSKVLRLLNKHLMDKCVNHNVEFENIWKPLFNQFCRFNGLNWKIKQNLMINIIQLLQQCKLNGLDIVNTYYGLKCLFNGGSVQIFKELTNSSHNLLNIKEIEKNNNNTINVIFDIFRERGKYIQQRHKNMMISFGKWLINNNKKDKLIQFIDQLMIDCQQITNNDALKQKYSVIIKRFQIEWTLR